MDHHIIILSSAVPLGEPTEESDKGWNKPQSRSTSLKRGMGYTGHTRHHLGRTLTPKVNWNQSKSLELTTSIQEIQRVAQQMEWYHEEATAKPDHGTIYRTKDLVSPRNRWLISKGGWGAVTEEAKETLQLNATCGLCWVSVNKPVIWKDIFMDMCTCMTESLWCPLETIKLFILNLESGSISSPSILFWLIWVLWISI